MYEQGTTAEWPNLEPKARGMFVENVHPLNRGRYPLGVVEWVEGEPLESVFVRIGRGSTVYGPAKHWRETSTKPEWLERLELEQAELVTCPECGSENACEGAGGELVCWCAEEPAA